MTLRLLEVYHPSIKKKDLKKLFKDITIIDVRQEQLSEKEMFSKILIPADKSEAVIGILEKEFSKYENFRVIILSIEAALPRVEDDEEEKKEKEDEEKSGISLDEICEDVSEVVIGNFDLSIIVPNIFYSTISLMGSLRIQLVPQFAI